MANSENPSMDKEVWSCFDLSAKQFQCITNMKEDKEKKMETIQEEGSYEEISQARELGKESVTVDRFHDVLMMTFGLSQLATHAR